MARGWESKAVEEQQAAAINTQQSRKVPLTPNEIAVERERQGLLLSRQRILSQLQATLNPAYRAMLQRSLADLDARLARLV